MAPPKPTGSILVFLGIGCSWPSTCPAVHVPGRGREAKAEKLRPQRQKEVGPSAILKSGWLPCLGRLGVNMEFFFSLTKKHHMETHSTAPALSTGGDHSGAPAMGGAEPAKSGRVFSMARGECAWSVCACPFGG